MQSSRATRTTAIITAIALSGSAHADTPPCSANVDTLNCHMQGFLHFLDATAVILALVLITVVALAVRFYRRNKTNPRAGE
jgi:hypothetical protein